MQTKSSTTKKEGNFTLANGFWRSYEEKAMAPHSSTLAWKIQWTEEPDGLHAVHGVAMSQTRLSDFTSL